MRRGRGRGKGVEGEDSKEGEGEEEKEERGRGREEEWGGEERRKGKGRRGGRGRGKGVEGDGERVADGTRHSCCNCVHPSCCQARTLATKWSHKSCRTHTVGIAWNSHSRTSLSRCHD